MRNNSYLKLPLAVVVSLFLFSCEKKPELVSPVEKPNSVAITDDTESETIRTDFAKALAQALKEKEVIHF